jgi:hypothetical protein
VSHGPGPRRVVDHRNKEGLATLDTQLGLRVSKARSCVAKAPVDVQAATIRLYSRSGFTTLPPVLLQEQPAVVLLLERVLVSWSLAMNERGGHEDLHGSGRRSVIPYVHGRTVLYCSILPSLSLPICPPL